VVIGKVYDGSHTVAFLVAGAVMAVGGIATLRVPKSEQDRVVSEQVIPG
jgi:hypothetical protein